MLASATKREDKQKQPYASVLVVLIGLVLMAVLGLVCTKIIAENQPARATKPARP